MSRPKAAPGTTFEKKVLFSISAEHHKKLQEHASASGVSMSQVIRDAVSAWILSFSKTFDASNPE